jgi:hypothetical protein
MVITALSLLAFTYITLSFVPAMGQYRLTAFISLLALSFGPMTLYNASWQAYFSDVVPIEDRNRTFTLRTKGTFLISIITPLVTGFLLSSASANEDKLRLHQLFFWIACILLAIQVFVLTRIRGGHVQAHTGISLRGISDAAVDLAHNKRFLSFVGVALFFYLTWQSDWTLYFVGQVNYLKLNEAWLSYVSVGGAVMQFLTIGFWSRMNEKHGIRFSIIFGCLGLAFCPICMIIGTSLPAGIGPYIFPVLHALTNLTFPPVMLNILQCLLQVIPEKNKTLSISIYTVLVTFSNAVMPMVGIQVYTAFGSDLRALQTTFWIIFICRLVATGLWALRWWLMRNEPKL